MHIAPNVVVLWVALSSAVVLVSSVDVARVRRVQRRADKTGDRGATRPAIADDVDVVGQQQQDGAFWERELGKNNGSHGSKGKGGSKGSKGGSKKSKGGGSKSKGKGGSKGRRMVQGVYVPGARNFAGEQVIEEEVEAIDFWNRELGNTGSHSKGSKGKGKGGSKSKGGSSKSKGSSKGRRALADEYASMTKERAAEEKDDVDFWNRELGKTGSHHSKGSKGKGGGSKSKGGSSKSKGSKGYRALEAEESDFMIAHAAKEKEDIDFWNRGLGKTRKG